MKRHHIQIGLVLCLLAGFTLSLEHRQTVYAQQAPSSLSLQAQAPSGITQGSASACSTCVGGGQSVFYYVIVRYPAGLAFPVNGIITARNTAGIGNLSGSNYNVITWGGQSGATGYDVIRQSTPGSPTSPCTGCAVTLNTSATTVNDTGQNGGNYPPNLPSVQNTIGQFSIDNLDFSVPRLLYAMTGAPNYYAAMVLGNATTGRPAIFNSDGSLSSGPAVGSGTVTQINTTAPILGGPITTTGTISADTTVLGQKFFGTTTPGSVPSNLPGDIYVNTSSQVQYYCGAAAGTPAPACTAVGAGNWTSNGAGTVTSITVSAPLTGGTITASGSIGANTTVLSQKFFGTAAPGSVTGNLPGDTFSDTNNHNDYWCNATAGTSAPACTSVTTGGWTQSNSSSSSSAADPYITVDGTNYFGPVYAVNKPPNVSALNWANQGGATGTTLASGALLMQTPANSGFSIRYLYQTGYPTTPYTFTIGLVCLAKGVDFSEMGIAISDGTKLATFGMGFDGGTVGAAHVLGFLAYNFASTTSYTSNISGVGNFSVLAGSTWFISLNDDGTTIAIKLGPTPDSMISMGSVTRSTLGFTPTRVGIFVQNDATGLDVSALFFHWAGI